MSNPAVLSLVRLRDIISGFPYRFDVEDNIGEAIHIHYKEIRLDLTIQEFLRLADEAEKIVNALVAVEGFSVDRFDPVFLVGLAGAGALASLQRIVEDECWLADLIVDTIDENGQECYANLQASRVTKALHGDVAQNDARKQINHFKRCSVEQYTNEERVQYNLQQIKQVGYPSGKDRIVLMNESSIIIDGQHRAACLYDAYGNIKVPVNRMYLSDLALSDAIANPHKYDINSLLFFRSDEEDFSETRKLHITNSMLKNRQVVAIPESLTELRFDPLEDDYCKVEGFSAQCSEGTIPVVWHNGFEHQGAFWFYNKDPQICLRLPTDGIREICITADVRKLNNPDVLMKALKEQNEDANQLATALREENKAINGKLEQISEQYNRLTKSVSWRITKPLRNAMHLLRRG